MILKRRWSILGLLAIFVAAVALVATMVPEAGATGPAQNTVEALQACIQDGGSPNSDRFNGGAGYTSQGSVSDGDFVANGFCEAPPPPPPPPVHPCESGASAWVSVRYEDHPGAERFEENGRVRYVSSGVCPTTTPVPTATAEEQSEGNGDVQGQGDGVTQVSTSTSPGAGNSQRAQPPQGGSQGNPPTPTGSAPVPQPEPESTPEPPPPTPTEVVPVYQPPPQMVEWNGRIMTMDEFLCFQDNHSNPFVDTLESTGCAS